MLCEQHQASYSVTICNQTYQKLLTTHYSVSLTHHSFNWHVIKLQGFPISLPLNWHIIKLQYPILIPISFHDQHVVKLQCSPLILNVPLVSSYHAWPSSIRKKKFILSLLTPFLPPKQEV